MKINAKFEHRVLVHSEEQTWLDSPMTGVSRRPLDRVGEEIARATSIVRYEAGSHFSPHVHTGGEEFIVLEGVFQDEHGDFPAGSYIRNPPQSSHQPKSASGCIIFVKLWQFIPEDRLHVRLNMNHMKATPHRNWPGISVIPLYYSADEEVSLVEFLPGASLALDVEHGAELLVLEGELNESRDILVKYSWLRTPIASHINATAGSNGAKVWIKQGHLNKVNAEINRVNKA